MGKMPRRHDEEERSTGALPASPKAADHASKPAGPTAMLLDLQARAGNTAVGGLLAGSGPTGLRAAVQRQADPTGAGEAAEAASGEATRGRAELTIPELRAPVRLQSVSLRSPVRPGQSGAPVRASDIDVTIAIRDFDPALQTAAANGTLYPTADISAAGVRYAIRDVYVAACMISGEVASMTLNASTIEIETGS